VAGLAFDLIALFTDEPAVFFKGAYWLIGIGIVGALVAATFGFLDLLAIPGGTPAFRTALLHMELNLTVIGLFVIGFAVRAAGSYEELSTPGLILSLVALALLGVSGWLGGKLAYHYGVRVADEATQARGFH
jgi:uncharacterized membrane protein